jgi:hypothetical protein
VDSLFSTYFIPGISSHISFACNSQHRKRRDKKNRSSQFFRHKLDTFPVVTYCRAIFQAMPGPRGYPRAENSIEIIKIPQAHERITLQVKAKRAAKVMPRPIIYAQCWKNTERGFIVSMWTSGQDYILRRPYGV